MSNRYTRRKNEEHDPKTFIERVQEFFGVQTQPPETPAYEAQQARKRTEVEYAPLGWDADAVRAQKGAK